MRCQRVLVVSLLVLAATPNHSAEKVRAGEKGEQSSDAALVYFIRPGVGAAAIIDLFAYANDSFVGVLDNDSYFFARLAPGRYTIETDREPSRLTKAGGPLAAASFEVDLVAGRTYYLDLKFVSRRDSRCVDTAEGERLLADVKWMSRPTAKQERKGTQWAVVRQLVREVDWSKDARDIVEDLQQRAGKNPSLAPDDILNIAEQARVELNLRRHPSRIRSGSLSHVYLEAWANAIAGQRALDQGERDRAVRCWKDAKSGFTETIRRADILPFRNNELRLIRPDSELRIIWVNETFPARIKTECVRQRDLASRLLGCDGVDAAAFRACVATAGEQATAPSVAPSSDE